jgi:hypothetical protein
MAGKAILTVLAGLVLLGMCTMSPALLLATLGLLILVMFLSTSKE